MAETTITTLTEFLRQSGVQYRIFDMGRRVSKISAADFFQFEQALTPYPMPFQRCALFGLIFWHPKQVDQQFVWFLRFPLDEQGLLLQAARDEFLVMVLERVGECMQAAAEGLNIEGALRDSPYSFNPREDKMAAFNAQAKLALSLPASQYYADALAYFTGQQPLNDWPLLGMQGVADVAIRLQKPADIRALIQLLPEMPAPAFQMLTTFFEQVELSVELTEAFAKQLTTELAKPTPDVATVCACLRATSFSSATGLHQQMVTQVLEHDCSQQIEVLAVLVGRCWATLADEQRCQLFIERLAFNEAGYEGFSHLIADLIYLPGLREPVMAALRNPARSEALSEFVGQLFGR